MKPLKTRDLHPCDSCGRPVEWVTAVSEETAE